VKWNETGDSAEELSMWLISYSNKKALPIGRASLSVTPLYLE